MEAGKTPTDVRRPAKVTTPAWRVDFGSEQQFDGGEEVARVGGGLKPDRRTAEQPFDQRTAPRAHAERLGPRPRDVPEGADAAERQLPANQQRRQRKVIVLHEDDRRSVLRFVGYRLGKQPVHELVGVKVASEERGFDRRTVTERPERAVGEAVVVAVLLLGVEKHAAKAIAWPIDRHLESVAVERRCAIRVARALCDPDAGMLQQERFNGVDDAG